MMGMGLQGGMRSPPGAGSSGGGAGEEGSGERRMSREGMATVQNLIAQNLMELAMTALPHASAASPSSSSSSSSSARKKPPPPPSPRPEHVPAEGQWACITCTLLNHGSDGVCTACGAARSGARDADAEQRRQPVLPATPRSPARRPRPPRGGSLNVRISSPLLGVAGGFRPFLIYVLALFSFFSRKDPTSLKPIPASPNVA